MAPDPPPQKSTRVSKPSTRVKEANNAASGANNGNTSSEFDSDNDVDPPAPPVPSATTTTSAQTAKDKTQKFNDRFQTAERTDEEVLDAQVRSWTSKVYDHFTMPPTIKVVDGEVKYEFCCKAHPSIKITRIRHDDGTSNLKRHVDACTPADTPESQQIAKYAQGSTYTEASHHVKIVLWIACRRRPFIIIEDAELLDIFKSLHAGAVTPSRHTISCDMREAHKITKEAVMKLLQTVTGKVHISVDGWTTPNVIAFIGIIVHYVLQGKLESLLLDFVQATKAHTGTYLAARVSECLQDFKIDKKVLALTCDQP